MWHLLNADLGKFSQMQFDYFSKERYAPIILIILIIRIKVRVSTNQQQKLRGLRIRSLAGMLKFWSLVLAVATGSRMHHLLLLLQYKKEKGQGSQWHLQLPRSPTKEWLTTIKLELRMISVQVVQKETHITSMKFQQWYTTAVKGSPCIQPVIGICQQHWWL